MAQEKSDKKDVKVQDLAPKKDAKGGGGRFNQNAVNADSVKSLDGANLNAANQNSASQNAASQNSASSNLD